MKKIVLAAVLATMGTAAMAEGGYVGALAGLGRLSADCVGGSCDRTNPAYRVFGGYEFASRFGLEVAYSNYGKYKAAGYNEIKAEAYSFGGTYRWQFSQNWDGTLRGGISSMRNEWSAPGNSDKSNDASFYAGFNLGYHFAQNAKLVAAVEATSVKVDGDNGSLVTGAVGVQFGF